MPGAARSKASDPIWTIRPPPQAPHAGHHGLHEQGRALHEEQQLVQVVLPGDVDRVDHRLRAGRVGHQHPDRAEGRRHVGHQAADRVLVGDVGPEGGRDATRGHDVGDHLLGVRRIGQVVDRDLPAVGREPARDVRAQPARCAGDERGASRRSHFLSYPSDRIPVWLPATHRPYPPGYLKDDGPAGASQSRRPACARRRNPVVAPGHLARRPVPPRPRPAATRPDPAPGPSRRAASPGWAAARPSGRIPAASSRRRPRPARATDARPHRHACAAARLARSATRRSSKPGGTGAPEVSVATSSAWRSARLFAPLPG